MTAYERGAEAREAYHKQGDLVGYRYAVEPVNPYRPSTRNYAEWVDGFLEIERDEV